jgi:hypothetical protein
MLTLTVKQDKQLRDVIRKVKAATNALNNLGIISPSKDELLDAGTTDGTLSKAIAKLEGACTRATTARDPF